MSEQSARLAPAPPPDTLVPARTWSAYFDRPLWPENFGATEALDVGSGRSLKDWKTFHDGAARLLDYLRHAGRNGLIVPAWSDGCALYPTKLIESTPRYDNGVFFSTAQDPCRKDVLELLFRMCDREGLQLTPMLDFSTPLASLEALRRQAGDNADGLEWVNADGARLAEKEPTYRGQMPYYNVLDERVQAAMAAVVQEFADRYAGHPAFGGVAIPLSAHGYAQLPPPEWGLDSVTLAAFARDTGIQAEPRTLPTRHRDAWLEWRAQRLAEFHGRLARIVAQARPGARLQLCTAHSLEQPRWELELQPNLLRRAGDDQLWLEAGISPSLYSGRDAPLLARPQRFAPTETLDDQALRMELNESAELNRSLANLSNVAVQFFHEPQTLRVHDFEKQSPFKSTYCWLVSQPTPVGAANRQRITHALAALDATSLIDGGWLLPQGQDDALRDVIDAYRALPAARFTSVPGNAQPLVARVYSSQQATYCYLVNDSPWPTEATVNVQAPPGAEFESLAPRRSLPQPRGAGQRGAWCVEMRPYDLVAVRINAPRVAITGVSAKVDPTVTARLKQRLADMRARAGTLPLNTSLDVVKNPGFERIDEDDAPAPGWVVDGDETAVTLDSAAPHGGNTAALIATDRNSVSLIGQAFAAPRLGRVQVSAWLRSADAERDVPLQVVLEGVIDGEQFERRLDCGKVTTHWTERRFVFDDLPWEGVEAVRVRFDMLAAGKLWLDDVTISAPGFSQAEMIELGKLLKLSGDRLAAGQVRDCQQLLDGYWPRFIEQRAALPERPTVDVANRPKPVEATPTGKPGMLDRINKWMPRFMR